MAKTNYLFLIGAAKAGTTSFARAFDGHPEVAVARTKEPRFFTDYGQRIWNGPQAAAFADSIARDWGSYQTLFGSGRWRLDASTDYLTCPETPDRIAAFAEKHPVKVVAVLRDPVARVVSEYQHTLRDSLQTDGLAASLAAEPQRIAAGWQPLFHHITRSRYARPIARYRALFGADFHLLDFHDPRGHAALIADMAGIIGVRPPGQVPHTNASFTPRSATLAKIMQADPVRGLARRVLPDAMRSRLRQGAERLNAGRANIPAATLAQIKADLAADIAWCQQDADVPTDHWPMAFGGAGEGPQADRTRAHADVQP